MSQHKSLLREKVPDNVAGDIAKFLSTKCGIPGCNPIFHVEDATEIINIIVNYNKKIKLGEEK
jgi:hypothetical protein